MKNAAQHFVPQFYLRRFSLDNASIGAFIPPNRFIDRASIKGQAQKRYMYGRSRALEKMLSELEGEWSGLLRAVSESATLPDLMSVGHRDLLYFLALQRGRTLSAAADHKEALARMEDFKQRAYAEVGRTPPPAPEVPHEQHVLRSLQIHLSAWPYLLDLQPLVILNDTTERFITSDAPVSFHNDALFNLEKGGATAYSSPGLLVFLPISPNRAILLYDRNLYSFGTVKDALVARALSSDVVNLNALTAANATRVLYYSPGQSRKEMRAAYDMARKVRAAKRNIIFETIHREGNGRRRVLALSPSCAQFSVRLSFLQTLRKRADRMRAILLQRPFPRHPELTCWLEANERAGEPNPASSAIRELQRSHADLYVNLSTRGRAFLGRIALRRIPGLNRDIFKGFRI